MQIVSIKRGFFGYINNVFSLYIMIVKVYVEDNIKLILYIYFRILEFYRFVVGFYEYYN